MPVHDGARYLGRAVRSILDQTFTDFELLVVDDGSSDGSPELVARWDDPRIRCVRNERNLGLVPTLNRGLELARGEIVARMDSDDVSLPQRLRRQVDFLDAHPEVGACGAWTVSMGARAGIRTGHPTRPDDVRCELLFQPALSHPTVCLRRRWFAREGLWYDARYVHAEDYDLWRRASSVFPLANLREVLLRYRVHPASVSRRKRCEQLASVARIHREMLMELGLSPSQRDLFLHEGGRMGTPDAPLADTEDWLLGLLRANRETGLHPEGAFEAAVGRRWLRAARRAARQGQRVSGRFARSALTDRVTVGERVRTVLRAAFQELRSGGSAAFKETPRTTDG